VASCLLTWLTKQFKAYDHLAIVKPHHPAIVTPRPEPEQKPSPAPVKSSSFLRFRSSSHTPIVSPRKVRFADDVELISPKRIALRKNKLQEALIRSMVIAVNNREYHTGFIIKMIYDLFINEERDLKLSTEAQHSYHQMDVFFHLTKRGPLLKAYLRADKDGEKYFPVLMYVTTNLTLSKEITPIVSKGDLRGLT